MNPTICCTFPADNALSDARLSYSAIEQAVVGYVYGNMHSP